MAIKKLPCHGSSIIRSSWTYYSWLVEVSLELKVFLPPPTTTNNDNEKVAS